MNEVTQILRRFETSDVEASAQLLPLVYDELRELAARELQEEPGGQTLQPTALVHEAYLRLIDQEDEPHWNHRGHFYAAAAEAMRRILVENARRKNRIKRGGNRKRVDLNSENLACDDRRGDLMALNEALEQLEAVDERKAKLVNLRYFAGLTTQQAANALGISVATANRDWDYARAWLLRKLTEDDSSDMA